MRVGISRREIYSCISHTEGCPKAPTDAYTARYGNTTDGIDATNLYQTEGNLAPVYPQPMYLIKFSCNTGYNQIYNDKGSAIVRCNEGGYDRIPIFCTCRSSYMSCFVFT